MRSMEEHWSEHLRVVESSLGPLKEQAAEVGDLLVDALGNGRKILACGNGGSATQASHFVGELMGRFIESRRPLPAIALAGDGGTLTCIANDFGYESLFERQIEALAQPGDLVFAFTTSGSSENVSRGLAMARKRQAISIALTGKAGLKGEPADFLLAVPSNSTALIQEIHLMLIHTLCGYLDTVLKQ